MSVAGRFRFPVCLAAVFVAACGLSTAVAQRLEAPSQEAPGSIVDVVYEERLAPAEVQAAAASAFGRFGPPVIENAVDVYRMQIVTTGLEGEPAEVTATMFVPVDPPRGASPLYVFGSGTTGLARHCAPSRELELPRPLGDYRGYLAAYAGRGIVTVFPDYLGFDDPDRPQAYFHAASEAHVMLDAARAARFAFEQARWLGELQDVVLMGGYSQGGHAAFAAADLRPQYAPDVPLRGMIGFGATTDVLPLFQEGPYYAPYVLASWSSIYGRSRVRSEEVLAERWLPSLERDAMSLCVDGAQRIYPFDADALYTSSFARALRDGTVERDFPSLYELFEQNASGLSGHGLPALVVQGGKDVIVHDATQERFVAALCEQGSDVQYLNVRDARHRDTRAAGFEEAVRWMLDRGTEVRAPSNCVRVLGEQREP